jgi:hypothetical protein
MAAEEQDPGEKVIWFSSGTIENYVLTVNPELIKIECFVPCCPTLGPNIECTHSISAEISNFFVEESSQVSVENLMYGAPHFEVEQWHELHKLIADFATENWVWNRTS